MSATQAPETANRNLPVPQGGSTLPVAAGETSSSAIAARERAAVEARFLVAMQRPRDFDTAFARLTKACARPAFAEVARYAKPVGGQKVHGLSIRFAEEARVLWGNLDVSAFLVFDDEERRIYRVIGTDLETNATDGVDVMVEKFVERRVVRDGMEVIGQRQNTNGQVVYKIRATEDDLIVKVNNQIAKARRNIILSLIPADVKETCENLIIETMANRDAKDPGAARKAIVQSFFALGVEPKQIAELLGHPLETVNPAELTLLRSYYTALKDGEATWAEIVEAHGGTRAKPSNGEHGDGPARGTAGLRDSLTKKADRPRKEAPAPEQGSAKREAPGAGEKVDEKCVECGQSGGKHLHSCWYSMHKEK